MEKSRLMIKVLVLFMLWIGGMNVMAQDCPEGSYPFELMDINNAPTGDFVCLTDVSSGGKAYCVWGGYVTSFSPALCDTVGGTIMYEIPSQPLTDASSLLIFLLGIYGTYIYRKRVAVK